MPALSQCSTFDSENSGCSSRTCNRDALRYFVYAVPGQNMRRYNRALDIGGATIVVISNMLAKHLTNGRREQRHHPARSGPIPRSQPRKRRPVA